MPDSDPAVELVWREVRELLDEELGCIAEKYRAVLVMSYLEGMTTEEVARRLGCPKGTVLSRLARGRDRLRARLVRRGVIISVGVMVGVLTARAAPAAVPAGVVQGTIKAAALTAAGQAAVGAIPATVAALTKGELRAMFLKKLKVVAVGLLAVCVAVAVTLGGTRQVLGDNKETPKDEEKIVGTWSLTSYEEGGQKTPAEAIKDAKVIIAADGKMTVKQLDGKETEGTYKLDPAKKPKEFSFTNDKGQTMLGIYKLDGDTLTVCYDRTGTQPAEFVSKEGSTVVLQVLKREKK